MPKLFRLQSIGRIRSLLLLIIVAGGLLTACGGQTKSDPTPNLDTEANATAALVPTALSGPPRIGPVVWARTIDPATGAPANTDTLTTDAPAIYAVFPIESLPAGSQLVAHWYFNDTSLDALDSAMRIDQDRNTGWLEFHIERVDSESWPRGRYAVVVDDGTTELQRAEITIS